MTATILIVGGTGNTGRRLAAHLLSRSEVRVTIAARHQDRAGAVAAELNRRHLGGRAAAVRLDAADQPSLRAALAEHDLVVVAAPTTALADRVARAALDAGVDYLDVQLGRQKHELLRSLAPRIESAGRCFITEAGFHPGLPAAMVRYAVFQLDAIERAIVAGYLSMGGGLPYSEGFTELAEAYRDYQAQVYRDGRWCSGGAFATRRIDFGSDIGVRRCYPMFLEELRALPAAYPSLRELGFYISETHPLNDWLVTPILWAWLKLRPGAVRTVGRLVWWGMRTFHRPPYRVELQVHAVGRRAGRRTEVRATVAHADGYELTAIPVVAALLQYLDGSARRPGLWLMGQLVDPPRLLADIQRIGAVVTTTVS